MNDEATQGRAVPSRTEDVVNDEVIDQKLEELAHRTAGVRPRADFQARVMAAIHDEPTPTSSGLVSGTGRLGWRVLPLAALAACAALLLAVHSESVYDDTLVSTYDESNLELGW